MCPLMLPPVTVPVAPAAPPSPPGAAWSGTLIVENTWTGDGRWFAPGSLYWENLPLPLRWGEEDWGQHQGAEHVGWINTVERAEDGRILGTGTAFDPEFVEYLRIVGHVGVSVDPDSLEGTEELPEGALLDVAPTEPVPIVDPKLRVSKARIRAATAVDIPAFIDATIQLDEALAASIAEAPPTHAGLVLQAEDTGRILMIQRGLDGTDDPNAGLWEFPGGSIDGNETPEAAANREFAEETGSSVPEGSTLVGSVRNGVYEAFYYTVPLELDYPIDEFTTVNPDNPDRDYFEALAWWEPAHVLEASSAIRPEVPATLEALQQEVPMKTVTAATEPVDDEALALPPDAGAPSSTLTDADKTFLTDLLALHTQEAELLSGYLGAADPASDVAMFAQYQAEVVDECDVQIQALLGNTGNLEVLPEDTLIASAAPVAPPKEWFEPFDLDGPTPLTITADGRVYGHLADWKSCHRGPEFGNQCVTPPSDPEPEWFYNNGEVITADGTPVKVGVVTVGGGHAGRNKTLQAAIEHYDNVAAQAAVVRVVEDDHGIGLFGSLVPEATPAQVAALRRSPLSGDWRKERGRFRLVAAHAVNTPGYPIAQPGALVASIKRHSFITTGRVARCEDCTDPLRPVADRLAKTLGLDHETLVAGYASRIFGTREEHAARFETIAGGQ